MHHDEPFLGTPTSGGWTRERIIFLSLSSVAAVVLLIAVRQVLLPFVLAIVIAYVLTPLVAWSEQRHVPRGIGIVLAYSLVLSVLTLGVWAIAPRLYDETVRFAREVPSMAHEFGERQGPTIERWTTLARSRPKQAPKKEEGALLISETKNGYEVRVGRGVSIVRQEDGVYRIVSDSVEEETFSVRQWVDDGVERIVRYAQLNALSFVKLGQTIVASLSRGILLVFMTLMVAGYLMYTRESVIGFFRSLFPKNYRPGFDLLLTRVDRGLSGVVRGQLLICLVNGVLSAIGFALFDLKYWPILSVLAGVMSIIPIFGSILSTIPAVLIGLTQDVWTALWVLLWILGIHQIEANLLNPKIIGVAAKIHPVLVIFALLVGEHFYGLWGALLAVPVLSVSQSIFNHFRYGLSDEDADSLAAAELLGKAGS